MRYLTYKELKPFIEYIERHLYKRYLTYKELKPLIAEKKSLSFRWKPCRQRYLTYKELKPTGADSPVWKGRREGATLPIRNWNDRLEPEVRPDLRFALPYL